MWTGKNNNEKDKNKTITTKMWKTKTTKKASRSSGSVKEDRSHDHLVISVEGSLEGLTAEAVLL